MASSKKILIIDDELDVVKYLSVVLSDYGFEVETSSSSEKALNLLDRFLPDLISLDIMMPRQSGIWFYREIRNDPRWSQIPVVIVSGIKEEKEFDFRELLPDESIPEPQAFFEKPIKVEQFVKQIKELLSVNE